MWQQVQPSAELRCQIIYCFFSSSGEEGSYGKLPNLLCYHTKTKKNKPIHLFSGKKTSTIALVKAQSQSHSTWKRIHHQRSGVCCLCLLQAFSITSQTLDSSQTYNASPGWVCYFPSQLQVKCLSYRPIFCHSFSPKQSKSFPGLLLSIRRGKKKLNSPETEYTKDSFMVAQQQKKETKPHSKAAFLLPPQSHPLFA